MEILPAVPGRHDRLNHTFDEHVRHLQRFLRLLRQAGVSIPLHKCFSLSNTVDYLVHVAQLHDAWKTLDAVHGIKALKTVADKRSFFGLCIVFRWFVKDFAKIAASLNAKLCKRQHKSFEKKLHRCRSLHCPLCDGKVS